MTNNDEKIFSATRLFWQSFGSYRVQLIMLVVLGFLSGLLEGVGVNAVIPLFSFVTDTPGEFSDTISKLIQQTFGTLGLSFSLTSLIALIICLFLLKAVVLFTANFDGKNQH